LCSIARSLEIMGEKWSLLIIRDAFDGISKFSDFRKSLGVSSDILTTRLNTLVAQGVMEKRLYREPDGGRGSKERFSYHLTEAGQKLRYVLGALIEWGDAYRPTGYGPSSVLVDGLTTDPVHLAFLDGEGRAIDVGRVQARRGPGYNAGRPASQPVVPDQT
jgi:DNA-binding HxlR family transcriptional regulator